MVRKISTRKGYGRKKSGTRCYIFRLRTPEAHPPSPTCQKRKLRINPRSARIVRAVLCVSLYFSPRHLRLLPNLNYAFFSHSSSKTSPRSAFQTHPGTINDTVSHLLVIVVSFNHLKISIQLWSNSQSKHAQKQQSGEFLFQQHQLCIHQTFWMLSKSLSSKPRLARMVWHLRPIPLGFWAVFWCQPNPDGKLPLSFTKVIFLLAISLKKSLYNVKYAVSVSKWLNI